MTPPEKRGRTIVLVMIASLFTPWPLVLLAAWPPSLGTVVCIALDSIVAWCLYRGYYWARIYVPASLVLVGLIGLLAAIFATPGWQKIPVLIISVVHFIPGAVLWGSPSVHAYFERYGWSRSVVLNLDGDDGV